MKFTPTYLTLKKRALILLVFVFCSLSGFAAGFDYTPTIIQLNKNHQGDTVGFNLVENIYRLFYKQILDEKVTLWESPAKQVKISPNALQLIESENEIAFRECENLFINEYWKLYKKSFEFQILGFSFYSRKADKTKVNFGYIDANDVKLVLSSTPIPTNINGPINLSYWQALMSKHYHFNIVKFGNVDLAKNPTFAFDLKSKVFESPKIKTNKYEIPDVKEVEYFVLPGLDSLSSGYLLCQAIEMYFEEHRNQYFNMTSVPVTSHLDLNTDLVVTRVEITEVWERKEDNEIAFVPQSVRIFINNTAMPELTMEGISDMKLLVEFRPIAEYIKDKEFKYNIKRVNYEPIYGYEAESVKQALFNNAWNKIDYVAPNTLNNKNPR